MNALVTSLFSSPLAERIGWALVHFLWQGTAVALLLAVALRLLRLSSPRGRWAASCAALGLMAILPFVTACMVSVDARPASHPLPAAEKAASATPSEAPADSAGPPSPDTVATAIATAGPMAPSLRVNEVAPAVPTVASWSRWAESALRPLLPYVFLCWLAGVAATSTWHIGGWFWLERYKRLGTRPAAASILEVFERLVERLSVRRTVRLLESSRITAPTVIGWLCPVVLLPAAAITGLTPPQLEAVLAHELAHVRRYDCLIRLIQAAVETLLFYHPAVWWVSACIRQESECCCDEVAVEVCGDRRGYAAALATVAQMDCRRMQLAAGAGGGTVLSRIRRILRHRRAERLSARSWVTSFLALGVLVALAALCIRSSEGQAQPAAGSKSAAATGAADSTETVPAEVQRQVERLGSGDFEESQAAIGELKRIGRPAVPAMVERMKQESSAYSAREVLRSMGREAEGALDWLIETARGTNADSRAYKSARWNAVYVLDGMGWAADRVIPVLAEVANDPKEDAGIRQAAISSLGGMGTGALPVLRSLARTSNAETRSYTHGVISQILEKNGTQTKQEYFTQLIEKDPFDPNVPGYLVSTHTVNWVNQEFENPLTQKVKALYRKRLAEEPDPALAWRLAGIIGTGLINTELQWAAPTDWFRGQQKREDRAESFVTMAEALDIAFHHAEKNSDIWHKSGTALARLRLLQGNWDAMNAILREMGDEPIPAESRPYLPAPPTDWGKGLRARWGVADESMRSGDCALEFRIEKDGKGLAGVHVLVERPPDPEEAHRTGLRNDTLFSEPMPGGFGHGGDDRAKTRYAVSDASGLVRFERLPKIPVKIEVLVPTSNFPEAGRSWSLWMEVEPGVLKLASRGGVGVNNPVAIVNLEEGKAVRYPRLVVTPAFELNVRNWERVDKDTFELRWGGLDPTKTKNVRYEVEMTLSAPAEVYAGGPVLQSARETVAGTTWPVGQKGVGGMHLAPGNIYEFTVRATDESGEIAGWWPGTRVWTPWPGRECQPPIWDRDSRTRSPIHHDIWWQGEFPGHLDTDKTDDAPVDRFLQGHRNAFEYDYVRVGKAWLAGRGGRNDEARGQLEQLVRELPAGNVARGTAVALLRKLAEGQPFPKNMEFVPDEAAGGESTKAKTTQ